MRWRPVIWPGWPPRCWGCPPGTCWVGDLASAQAVVAATQRVLNAVSAVQVLGIEAWSRRTGEGIAADRAAWGAAHPGRAYPGPRDEHEFMDCELAPVLHVAPRTAQRTYEMARTVCAVLPATWAAMRAGDLEPARAEAIAQEVPAAAPGDLRPGRASAVSGRAGPADRPGPGRGPAGGRGGRPGRGRRAGRRARAARFVLVRPGVDPGMSEWVAAQPAESSAAAWAAIDELAHAYVADGEHRSLEQARADAMIDLILGQATITTTVELNLPLSVLPAPRAARPLGGDATATPTRAAVPGTGGGCSCGGTGIHRIPGACRTGACSCRGSGSRRPGSG